MTENSTIIKNNTIILNVIAERQEIRRKTLIEIADDAIDFMNQKTIERDNKRLETLELLDWNKPLIIFTPNEEERWEQIKENIQQLFVV